MVLLFTIIFLLSCGCERIFGKENCDDCTPIMNCPEAVNLVRIDKSAETQQLVMNAFCGHRHKQIQVCCSEFKNRTGMPTEAYKDSIESHRNVHVLPKLCGEAMVLKLLGGNTVLNYELPFMAQLFYNKDGTLKFLCTGSIIHSRYVLTAASCIKMNRMAGVRVGEIDMRYKTDCDYAAVCESHLQDLAIEEIIVHEGYKFRPFVQNDIALIRLSTDIDFSYRNAAPICLPIAQRLRSPLKEGDMGIVTGWGISQSYAAPSMLLKTVLTIVSNDTCRAFYDNNQRFGQEFKIVKQFCAGKMYGYSCSGDQGGPFVVEKSFNDTYNNYQYGIVSVGPEQCGTGYPGIYTSVIDHMGWILDNIRP